MSIYIAFGFLVIMAIIGAYDIFAIFALPPGNTVSYVLQSWATEFPALAFAVGFLIGHLFWPLRHP
jgi:hypothetical protein